MGHIVEWIGRNKDWLFSGIGVLLIGFLLDRLFKKKDGAGINQTQRSGDNSSNIQVGHNVRIKKK